MSTFVMSVKALTFEGAALVSRIVGAGFLTGIKQEAAGRGQLNVYTGLR